MIILVEYKIIHFYLRIKYCQKIKKCKHIPTYKIKNKFLMRIQIIHYQQRWHPKNSEMISKKYKKIETNQISQIQNMLILINWEILTKTF